MPMRGMITNINFARGCGFIQPEAAPGGREVYFEQDVVTGRPFRDLHFGEMVRYELRDEPPPPAELRAALVEPESE